ncbi:MAG: hypothetical protein VKP70_09960 [Cyanobacteriota bacterium]|nr:hypothetical protein [Cyanobacteriota bacterium]
MKSDKSLQGGIELITPSLITGWVYHPHVPCSDVRLLVGPHLLAQAPINQPRPDVEQHLQQQGHFGFQLNIPPDLPLLRLEVDPLILALTADGSQRFPLTLLGARSATRERLMAALEAEMRGLRGHFDGLSSDRTRIHGWCYRMGGHEPATVWLHAEGVPPYPLTCHEPRPGMASQGHREFCGFSLSISEWPGASGARIWASFDERGLLRLPQATPVDLPPRAGSLPTSLAVEAQRPGSGGLAAERPSVHPTTVQNNWQTLETFRQYLDGLEEHLDHQEHMHSRPSIRRRIWSKLMGSGH